MRSQMVLLEAARRAAEPKPEPLIRQAAAPEVSTELRPATSVQ